MTTDRDRETAEDVVRAEWLHAVDTGAIIDYGSQDAVHAAMDHMADAFAAALAAERARVLAPVLALAEELAFASDDLPPAVDAGSAAIRKDAREALADAAVRIRRAAQDGES